ncbi:MAG: peptide ABC transporter substrate-binding protein [Pseudomonadota bacterium]
MALRIGTLFCIACICAFNSVAWAERTTAPSHIRIATAGEPQTLDPHRYNLRLEETLLNDLFMGLTTFGAAGDIVPGAAARWHTSDDGLVWTFELRKDLYWSDGVPLNANDFVFSLQRLLDPATAASLAYFMYMIDNAAAVNRGAQPTTALGVRAIDEHTLELRLEKPYPYLLERLLYPTAFPVPAHVIREHGSAWTKAEHWVSNGAYTLDEWRPQSHVRMQANSRFITPPRISQITYLPLANEQNAYNRYRNKEVDVIGAFPATELDAVRRTYSADLRLSNLLSMAYLVFNLQVPALADIRVRQALSLAVDQRVLTDQVMRSGAAPAFSFAPAMIDDYDSAELPHKEIPYADRLSQAKALLAAAGYTQQNPLRVTLRHMSTLENKKINLAISGMWRQIGVRTQLQQADVRTHFSALRQGDFDVAWAAWVGENNAEHYLSLLQSDIGNVNYGRFADPHYDDLMREVSLTADASQRNARLQRAEQHVVQRYPVIPLYTMAVRRLVSPHLQGWQENPRDMHQSRYLSWPESAR